jgi:nucleotide-binding universal stress UspA family protein
MSSTVLLPVKNHAPWARDMAETVASIEDEDTEVIVLYVFSREEIESTRANLNASKELSLNDLASRKTSADATANILNDEGLDTTLCGVRENNRRADAVLEMVESVDGDRIYLYSRKRSPAGKAVFGSTVQRVILNARVPVTIVPFGSVQ